MKTTTFFSTSLLQWHYNKNSRHFQWKGVTDPYTIWIREVILQQTRVNFGADYYHRFIKAYPTVHDLAKANDEEVFKLWQGLGYYSRCRNLIYSARFICDNFNGIFPGTYEEILQLKGVGTYTAAAIASFAFGLPHAVVDGNVARILARFYGIKTPIDTTSGKKKITALAQEHMPEQEAAAYNQAIMDFGAVICKPALPQCDICPLKTKCYAFRNNETDKLPVKQQKLKIKHRFFNYLVIENSDYTWVQKRGGRDIWQHLYQFPLIETDTLLSATELQKHADFQQYHEQMELDLQHQGDPKPQQLTHQKIHARFFHLQARHQPVMPHFILVSREKLSSLPLPKIIASYLQY